MVKTVYMAAAVAEQFLINHQQLGVVVPVEMELL
jgi:hypothetical protein